MYIFKICVYPLCQKAAVKYARRQKRIVYIYYINYIILCNLYNICKQYASAGVRILLQAFWATYDEITNINSMRDEKCALFSFV